jgi:hypothetical protein
MNRYMQVPASHQHMATFDRFGQLFRCTRPKLLLLAYSGSHSVFGPSVHNSRNTVDRLIQHGFAFLRRDRAPGGSYPGWSLLNLTTASRIQAKRMDQSSHRAGQPESLTLPGVDTPGLSIRSLAYDSNDGRRPLECFRASTASPYGRAEDRFRRTPARRTAVERACTWVRDPGWSMIATPPIRKTLQRRCPSMHKFSHVRGSSGFN